MLRDPPWPKIGVTFDYQKGWVTGAGWAVVFWWFRHREVPADLSCVPHFRRLPQIACRKHYVREYHYSVGDRLLTEAYELPW